jgi:hypothetical protein
MCRWSGNPGSLGSFGQRYPRGLGGENIKQIENAIDG